VRTEKISQPKRPPPEGGPLLRRSHSASPAGVIGTAVLHSPPNDLDAAAERRIGELMEAQRETVGLAQGRRTDLGPKPTQVGTLAEAGIDKHLADRARKYTQLTHEVEGLAP
jgi:hypothetical protein